MPGLPAPGAEWAGFQIEQRIGRQGFGQVFTAWDPERDRRVAIKVLPADADPTAAERFRRESRTAGDLGHPRVVPIHEVGEHDGSSYVVMDHVAGGDLGQQIHVAPLTVERTRSVVGQLAGALDTAHQAGLVHRGVEPANVLCAAEADEVYLTDFGAPGASLRYAAPEQIRGEAATPATDVYGLGCTLFECLTGRLPFPGETPDEVTAHQLTTPPPRVTELRPDLPTEFDDVVARAMAKDPADRYPGPRHLAEAVALVRVDEPSALAPTALAAAAFEPTTSTPEIPDDAAADERRSVFDDTAVIPAATGGGPADVGDTVDGAAYGIYEEERRRSRLPAVVITLLVLAVAGVAFLVWRAVNTEAELGTAEPGPTTSTTTVPGNDDPVVPTVAAARALIPAGVDTCVDPEGEAASADPIVLSCPSDGVPETVVLELFSTHAARNARLDALASELDIATRDDAECALGRMGGHPYEADGHGGRVLCREADGAVDFVWTRDDAPVLFRARGAGRFVDHERAWDQMAERTDATFPTGEEARLLDALPDAYTEDCERDLNLVLATGGVVAAACRPPDEEPDVISWVLFPDDDPMDAWIAERRASLDENNFDTTDDGCTPQGFGQVESATEVPIEPEGEAPAEGTTAPVAGPPPDAAFVDYDLDGTRGEALCFINTSGQNALFWTRNGSRIGSIAVTEQANGDSMTALLRWWRDGGHRP